VRAVRFVVPEGIDDPLRVSGGNVYDRRVRDGLRRRGWQVEMHEAADGAAVAEAVGHAGGTVLVDGLAAGWAAHALDAAADRIRLVVLAHMIAAAFPGADAATVDAERRSIRAAHRVVATSRWTAGELVTRGLADHARITVAAPGTGSVAQGPDAGAAEPGDARRLLCVGVVAPHKGQDLLLEALAGLAERDWTCTLVGSALTSPAFAAGIARQSTAFAGRVRMPGVLGDAALADEYRRSGVLVAPSRVESAGMAIADARARGIPVIGTAVGGIPDTVAGGGAILVPPDDPVALAAALRAWLTDPVLRARLRGEARAAAETAPHWDDTIAVIERALVTA